MTLPPFSSAPAALARHCVILATLVCACWGCGDDAAGPSTGGNSSTGTSKTGQTVGTIKGTQTTGTLGQTSSSTSTQGSMTMATTDQGPDDDGDGLSDAAEAKLGTDPMNPDTDGDGVLDGVEVATGTDPKTKDMSCASFEQTPSPTKKPVDVIIVVDNSGSMDDEIRSVERNINKNFAQIIGDSGIDYRVILISQNGDPDINGGICIDAPLSSATCDPTPPATPGKVEGRFYHYSQRVSSGDSLAVILRTYTMGNNFNLTGWSTWLRPESFKVFIEITDDVPDGFTAERFDEEILALQPALFGVSGVRQYTFHSIVGMAPKADPNQAWGPSEPIQKDQKCQSAVANGDAYQKLSVLTGGLRFPVCNVESYDAVFKDVAKGIIKDSGIRCTFGFPAAPGDQVISSNRVGLQLTDATGTTRALKKVADAAACDLDAYYVFRNEVTLCPALCSEVEALSDGALKFFGACEPKACVPTHPVEQCGDGIDNDCDGFIDGQEPICLG